jgi:hypothetical protein
MIPRRHRLLQQLAVVVVGGVAGVGALAGPAVAADPVGGPNGPEIACLNPLVSQGQQLRCRLSGFAPNAPVVVTIAGEGVVATVRPRSDGTRSVDLDWPFTRFGYHQVSAVQRDGSSTLRSTTHASRGTVTPAEATATPDTDAAATTDDTPRRAPDEPAADAVTESVDRGQSQVPLRVSVAIGLGVAGLGVLFVRQRRRARFGL